MTKEELIEKMNTVLSDEFEIEKSGITPEAPIKETLHLDSLSLVDMVGLVEEEFGVAIATAEVKTIRTFDDLYTYVFTRL